MEIIDLYDNKKQKLNKTMERSSGEPLVGEYKLSVHTWILNSNGQLLIQRRSDELDKNPGKWAFTGGAVDTNETSLEGAKREVREELGVEIENDEIEFLLSFKREKGFVDVWLVKKDISIENLKLQSEEVAEVKWVSLEELKELAERGDIVKSVKLYLDLFIKLLQKCHNAR